jgi:hypothetical protein
VCVRRTDKGYLAKKHDGSDDDHKSNKKTKLAKSEKKAMKSGQKTDMESSPMYCTHCKTDTHNMERCWKLKKIAREKELSKKKAPYSKQTFCKEVNAIAHRAGKNGNFKRNTQKWPVPKRLSLATQTPLMSPLMLWNQVKGGIPRNRDMRSVLSNLTL